MGRSYDAIYAYGLLYELGSSDNDHDWPDLTDKAIRALMGLDEDCHTDSGSLDFDDVLCKILGLETDWDTTKADGYHRAQAERHRACHARFGVDWFKQVWLGYVDYPIYGVAPTDAILQVHAGSRVPVFNERDIDTWRIACKRLGEVLPGADAPGLFFGCHCG